MQQTNNGKWTRLSRWDIEHCSPHDSMRSSVTYTYPQNVRLVPFSVCVFVAHCMCVSVCVSRPKCWPYQRTCQKSEKGFEPRRWLSHVMGIIENWQFIAIGTPTFGLLALLAMIKITKARKYTHTHTHSTTHTHSHSHSLALTHLIGDENVSEWALIST